MAGTCDTGACCPRSTSFPARRTGAIGGWSAATFGLRRLRRVVSGDTVHLPERPVPPMSAEHRQRDDDVRGAIDALADRVDTLASMVRETAGSLAANRGEVASLDRRVEERIGEDTQRSAAALASVRGEIEALRGFVAEAPKRSGTVAAAVSDPLRETIATLTDRTETLSEIVRSTAGRLVAEQTRISVLAEALARGDERAEARFDEVRRDLRVVSEQASRAAAPPSPTSVDPGLEQRVAQQVGALVERVDFLAGTATATAGRLAAKDGELARLEQLREETLTRTDESVRSMRNDLEALNARLAVDPMLQQRVDGLFDTVQTLGDRVGTLSGIVGETAGRSTGREVESAALDSRLGDVGLRIDEVARELRREIDALAAVAPDGPASAADPGELEAKVAAFGAQLVRLEGVVADASGATEQVGVELREEIVALAAAVAKEHVDVVAATREWEARRSALETRMDDLAAFATSTAERGSGEIAALAAAVARKHSDVVEATREWEARRSALETRMDDLAAFAASTAERGADELGRALHTLAERLERLEHDRQAVASDATYAESTWAQERVALEARLDAIATAITVERPQAPEVEYLVDELAGRLARMEGERETVADLAALAETWTTELATLEARVEAGLSTLEDHATAGVSGVAGTADLNAGLSENLDELTERIEQIERDRDAVRDELARTATSWTAERASLQERVSELAARIVTGPVPAATEVDGDLFTQTPQELDRLRIGVEGLRMRLAYHEKTVSDLAGSRGVVQRLDELSARLDQLAAIVAAGPASVGLAGAAPRMQLHVPETSGLVSRLDEADRLRNQTREKMLEQMEKIASRMDWRLQRLEAAGIGSDPRDG